MIAPMVLHLIGILIIGLVPAIGIHIVFKPTQIFMALSSEPTATLETFVPTSLLNLLMIASSH